MDEADRSADVLLTCIACEQLLREPVQLNCLHHCCRSCLQTISSYPTSNGGLALTCPACEMVTRVSSDPDDLPENRFVGSLLAQHAFRTGPLRCAFGFACGSEDDDGDVQFEAAEHWCHECQKPLCSKCLQPHGRHYRDSSHETVPAAAAAAAAAVAADEGVVKAEPAGAVKQLSMCRLHRKTFDFYCARCDKLRCSACCQSCLGDGHGGALKHVSDPWFVDRKQRAADAIRAARDALCASSDSIRKLLNSPDEAEAARRHDIQLLESSKREVLDIVQNAFDQSKLILEQHYDELGTASAQPVEEARCIANRLSHAVAYADALLRATGEADLLQQETELLPVLQRLGSEADSSVGASSCHSSLVIDMRRPVDFSEIIQQAIGIPRAAVTPGSPACSTAAAPTAGRKSPASSEGRACDSGACSSEGSVPPGNSSHESENYSSTDGRQIGASMARSPPNVGVLPASSESPKPDTSAARIKAGVRCRDVAITQEGHILIADGTVKEYAADSGQMLSHWSPASSGADGCRTVQDKVFTIGLLQDGSVVAGLLLSCRLLLLKRAVGATAWHAEDRSLRMPAHPVRLSAYGDMCAVSCSNEALIDTPATCVYLVSLASNVTLMNLNPGFGVSNLCLTKQALLVSSIGKQRMWDGSQCWVLDAYNRNAERLWRQELYDEVTGMCLAPDGELPSVWAAQPHRSGIATVALRDGVQRPLFSGKPGLERPWLLASSSSGGRRSSDGSSEPLLAAVCADDGHLVSVYRLSELK